MSTAKQGDTVKIHYTGKLEDGQVFDTSKGHDPLEFTIGEGRIIPGFEEAVVGMEPGEQKTVSIPPDKAYGPHHPEMVQEVEKSAIPSEIDLQEGMQLEATQPDQSTVILTVVGVGDDTVTLDANHPLAGQDLTFELELVEIG